MNSYSDYRAPRSLREVCDSPEHFSGIVSLVEQLAAQDTAPELVSTLRDATRRLGADASYFARIREDFDSFRLLVACDPVWSLQYEGKDCFAADPWLRYARSHTEATLSANLEGRQRARAADRRPCGALRVQLRLCRARTGGPGSRTGVLVLGSRRDNFFDDKGMPAFRCIARGLAMELHDRFTELMRSELRMRCHLTPFDLELLTHERDGRPTKVIATLLGCSVGAVDQRFHRLYARRASPIALRRHVW